MKSDYIDNDCDMRKLSWHVCVPCCLRFLSLEQETMNMSKQGRSHVMRSMRVQWKRHITGTVVFTTELIEVRWLMDGHHNLTGDGACALCKKANMSGFIPFLCPRR